MRLHYRNAASPSLAKPFDMSVAGRTKVLPAAGAVTPRVNVRAAGTVLLVAAICAVPVIVYLPFLTEPFFRDEGYYAAVAQVVLHGGVPYRDAFDNKPPMIFAWYTLSFLIWGENVWAPRLLVSLLLSGATLLMYLEGRLLFSHRSGLVAAAAFAFAMGVATLETSANTEYYMIPPLVAALYTFSKGQKSGAAGWYFAAGFFSAVAIATKHISVFTFVLYLGLAAVPVLRANGLRGFALPEFRRSVGGLIAGAALATGLVALPFILTGTMPEMFDATVVYVFKYVSGGSTADKLEILRRSPLYLTFIVGPWLMLAVLGALQVWRSGANGHGPLVLGWLAASWLGIIAAGRFYDHYYAALLPALALMAPLGARFLRDRWSKPATKIVALGILPLLFVTPLVQNAGIYFQPTQAERHIAKYAGDDRAAWENQGPAFGAWLEARTQPGDGIYVFGFQPEVYFHADRRSPTRFLFDRPFWYRDSYISEAIEELNANPPVYVIDSAVYEDWSAGKKYTHEIKAWIVANYDYVGKVYYADVWRLKGTGE